MTELKEAAKRVFLGTLRAIEPDCVIKRQLRVDDDILSLGDRQIPLKSFNEIVLIGMGKACLKMGSAVETLLGDRITRGILVTDRRSQIPVRSEVVVAGHPLPDANSLIAGKKIEAILGSCGNDALLVFLISGGGSSLVELPRSRSISLEDLRVLNQVLISCGATISEINTIRKSLSRIKGGGLGRLASQSTCIGLYFSDVNPGDLRSIASNPLLPEDIATADVLDVVNRFDLLERLPASVANAIRHRNASGMLENRNSGVTEALTMLVLDNTYAIRVAGRIAEELGFRVDVCVDLIEGDYRVVADQAIDRLVNLKNSFPNERVCVISGGEVSCSVRRGGIGGRNQEFVLYCATRLASLGILDGAIALSCGTDGIDGNSKAAGAVADAELVINAARRGAEASDFISNNDSYSFFKKAGGLVVTGPSGNNVRDLRLLMAQ